MLKALSPDSWSPRAVVLAPMAVLTAIFVLVVAFYTVGVRGGALPVWALAVVGLSLYGAAIFLVGRLGLASINNLEQLGITDSLSGLPNRRALHLDIASRASNNEEVAIALIDLDGFKQVNDHYGHHVGDELIHAAADALREQCNRDAACYRLGGDEFAIVVIGNLAGTILEGISRRVVDRFKRPIAIDQRRLVVGASIGLSRTNGRDGLSSSELLRRSDVAMYASKRAGKMRCTWYTADFDRNREALRDLDHELRSGLTNGEFRMLYQPLVHAGSGDIAAVEALIRWDRADGRKIGPNVFIPIAEETGLINPIGLWVLQQSCKDALGWHGLKLSVNISAAQLRNPEFPVQIGHILEETGFPAERLELEVTETCLVLDPVVVGRSLDVIRSFGVSIALDDFGTGYASIGFLRQFKFQKLKLDRSLVIDAQADDGSRAMMLSSISVARAMAMGVTAEGVETEEQAALVRAAGADLIQGWLYHRAMPPEQVQSLLDRQNARNSNTAQLDEDGGVQVA